MPHPLRRSLALRTTLVVLAVALLVGGLGQAVAARLAARWEADTQKEALESLLDVVAPSAAAASFARDQALAQQLADGLEGSPLVYSAQITAGGQLLALAQDSGARPQAAQEWVRPLNSPFDPGVRIGELSITLDPREAARREAAIVSLSRLTLVGLGLAMGAAVAAAQHGLILAPLERLTLRLHHLDMGAGARLETPRGHGEDVIGRLVADVNGLVYRLTEALWKEQDLHRQMARQGSLDGSGAAAPGVFLVGLGDRLESWNMAFATLVGREADPPVPGMRFAPLFGAAAEQVQACLDQSLAGPGWASATLRLEAPGGGPPRWLQLALEPIAGGYRQGLVDDITSRREAKQA